jgi:hypothetical protein
MEYEPLLLLYSIFLLKEGTGILSLHKYKDFGVYSMNKKGGRR